MLRLPGGSALITAPWSLRCKASWSRTSIHNGLVLPFSVPTRKASTLNFQDLDKKWQKRWKQMQKTPPKDGNSKEYVLAMFPYPSGALHMGHVRVYTIADVLARFKRMQGHNTSREVIYPMGWDAFGLPAENAAIERGLDPTEWTESNIAKMKEQLQAMNTDIDWSRELITCKPDFYKHTQRLFLLLHEHGMAYQAESLVNYDPVDRTVLANEQVDSNGFSWRSGAKVEKLNLKQWFFRITDFKEELLEDLSLLVRWPERVIAMQKNWIGKSTGTRLSFKVVSEIGGLSNSIPVFTTRLDTLFGVQFLALSASHPLVTALAEDDTELAAFIKALPNMPEGSKTGYRLQGVSAYNPLSQLPGTSLFVKEHLPIWVTPYVKGDYGEGAVMGVPAHDERDFAFWKENHRDQSIRSVVAPSISHKLGERLQQEVFADEGELRANCEPYAGLTSEVAAQTILQDLKAHKIDAEQLDTWRLRDWLISRQRYWGAPIPIIHCHTCGPVPVPVEDLPVELPRLKPETFQQRKGNPLEKAKDWLNVPCPKCKAPSKRDTDTMDTFVDSSWYMFRFADPHNKELPFSITKANEYMPVNTYVGGIEHAILHLLYARFIAKFLARIGMWPAGQSEEVRGEPFNQLISQGMVHGKTFSDPDTGRFLKPEEVDLTKPSRPLIKASDRPPNTTFEKMSKSKYNGVDPTDLIDRYGADITRAHMLFQAPVTEVLEWDEARIVGVQRWMVRLYRFVEESVTRLKQASSPEAAVSLDYKYFDHIDISKLSKGQVELYLKTQRTVSSITTSLSETFTLNTCISDLMILTNELTSSNEQTPPELLYYLNRTIIQLVGPFAPAFAEEAWELLHSSSTDTRQSVFGHAWPEVTNLSELEHWATLNMKLPCAIMENGKLRFVLDFDPMPDGLHENDKLAWALKQMSQHTKGREWLEKKQIDGGWKKVIVVQSGKTINFVGAASKP